ncbi:HPr family phosphocarrier protein [Arthrobacter sp. MDT3-44]
MELDVVVGAQGGLHAIIATRLAAAVEASGATVLLALTSDPSYQVDASRLMAVLSLGAAAGESLTVSCDGPHAETTLDTIAAVISSPG